jgi:hypothetical protein
MSNDRKPGWQADRHTFHKDNRPKKKHLYDVPIENWRDRRRAIEERQEIANATEWL